MKKNLWLLLMLVIGLSTVFVACDKDDEEETPPTPTYTTVTLGAQDNATYPGFYSVNLKKTYTQDLAFADQANIDIFCFYEAAGGNNIALAGPGTGINGIFTGASSPENYTVTDTTRFIKTTLTTAQFDAMFETDQAIVSAYDAENSSRKAKNLTVNDVVAFKTQDNLYGLLKVTEVVQDSIGYAKFQMKVKK